jgi:RNA polymerase sigma-70 factor (ECF subfamily)
MSRETPGLSRPAPPPAGELLDDTAQLLGRWRNGDRAAFDAILRDAMPWLTAHVDRRLGDHLRSHAELEDFVQDALVDFLTYGPNFEVRSRALLYGLLKRIVENVLRDRNDYYKAKRRTRSVERPLPSDSVLRLDPPRARVETPSGELRKSEDEMRLRMALELMEPQERQILVMREWEHLTFAKIGAEIGISEPAARMRSHRAMVHLSEIVHRMEEKGLAAVLDSDPPR